MPSSSLRRKADTRARFEQRRSGAGRTAHGAKRREGVSARARTRLGRVHLELLDGEARVERHVVVALVKRDPVLLARAAEEDLGRVDWAHVER